MLVSYQWLQTFFAKPLPTPDALAELLTQHSSEVEEVVAVGDDTVLDIKVLPDKSAWLMSHRGVAAEVAAITGQAMAHDPLRSELALEPILPNLTITLETEVCDYYGAALITGVAVGPSPAWLKARLEAIGQRSINNIVDATNYVMFTMGQPLHAFDASKLTSPDGHYSVGVRAARADESITSLTGEAYTLTGEDAVIIDAGTDAPIALAGVKGGALAAVDAATTTLLLEAAHFDRVAVRKTAQRHKLQTDASRRYENGVPRLFAHYGLTQAAALIVELAGGTIEGYCSAGTVAPEERASVSVTLGQINSVLGLHLSHEDVVSVLHQYGYQYDVMDDVFLVTPPPERDDLVIYQDIIEEIGRIYGLDKIVAKPPQSLPIAAINARQYYAERIRRVLLDAGFSEVFTSSFRNTDQVKLANALASDKGYLRSTLADNLAEARAKNIPHRDLLGMASIKVFEIGTVFLPDEEYFEVGLAVQTNTDYKPKVDDQLYQGAITALEADLGITLEVMVSAPGIVTFSLDALVAQLPVPTDYEPLTPAAPVSYRPFSVYPAVSRDVAMWVGESVTVAAVDTLLRTTAGPLCVRITHLDTFSKDGRTSLAFRLVFQSHEKTLDGSEVDALMEAVYDAVAKAGWEVR